MQTKSQPPAGEAQKAHLGLHRTAVGGCRSGGGCRSAPAWWTSSQVARSGAWAAHLLLTLDGPGHVAAPEGCMSAVWPACDAAAVKHPTLCLACADVACSLHVAAPADSVSGGRVPTPCLAPADVASSLHVLAPAEFASVWRAPTPNLLRAAVAVAALPSLSPAPATPAHSLHVPAPAGHSASRAALSRLPSPSLPRAAVVCSLQVLAPAGCTAPWLAACREACSQAQEAADAAPAWAAELAPAGAQAAGGGSRLGGRSGAVLPARAAQSSQRRPLARSLHAATHQS